jgi:hypothetical protein
MEILLEKHPIEVIVVTIPLPSNDHNRLMMVLSEEHLPEVKVMIHLPDSDHNHLVVI